MSLKDSECVNNNNEYVFERAINIWENDFAMTVKVWIIVMCMCVNE